MPPAGYSEELEGLVFDALSLGETVLREKL
jgi:hypothetical protein